MEQNKKIIIYNDVEYKISLKIINWLNNYGVEMNDQYIEYLLKNSNSYYNNAIEFLALMDLFNRKYIGEKGQLGRIVKIDKNGTILEYFDSVFDACIDSITSK